ncbi:LysR family transcriptional regulator [Mitsuaria sp. GD03876]|uniref:LysR family transcriptional regulator n=1 Tax=Mitsuaria sp. GD03876 TaxID=2975399 RepID=UPI0024479A52|nr:LysR family transcriptional regulator [Mitsuaria sp. GD03876]MDH0864457.1 LysR family transcriptional regulator [Mitsuaria sp. GD03876]
MDQLLALRLFVRITESGAFAHAADSLGIPRPTATKVIQRLERHLGIRLLQRTPRKVVPTEEGAAYYEHAVSFLLAFDELEISARGADAALRGRLRVDAGSAIADLLIVPALPAFQAMHPGIQLELGVSDRPVDLIRDGVDCAVRGGPLDGQALVARKLAELEWVTCASPGYLQARGTPLDPSELMPAPAPSSSALGTRRPHSCLGHRTKGTGEAHPLIFERGDVSVSIDRSDELCVDDAHSHIAALMAGVGVGQTLRAAVTRQLDEGSLVEVLGAWSRPRYPIHVLHPAERPPAPKVRRFMDWIEAVFRPIDAGAESARHSAIEAAEATEAT